GAPVAASEIDRLLEEDRLLEGDVKFEPGAARERGFREQKIAAAGAAANGEIVEPKIEIGENRGDGLGRERLLVRRKARLGAAGRVDHVAAEEDNLARRVKARLGHGIALRFKVLG